MPQGMRSIWVTFRRSSARRGQTQADLDQHLSATRQTQGGDLGMLERTDDLSSMCRLSLDKLRVDEEEFRQWLRNGLPLQRERLGDSLRIQRDLAELKALPHTQAANTVSSRLPFGVSAFRVPGADTLRTNFLGDDLTLGRPEILLLTILFFVQVRMLLWVMSRYRSRRSNSHTKTQDVAYEDGDLATSCVEDTELSEGITS